MSRAQITLDGIRDRHNLTRYVKGNHAATFDVISKNIMSLATKIPSADIAIRVNINRVNYMDFVELYKYYNTFLKINYNILLKLLSTMLYSTLIHYIILY